MYLSIPATSLEGGEGTDQEKLQRFLDTHCELLSRHKIRRLTFLIIRDRTYPVFHTFRSRLNVSIYPIVLILHDRNKIVTLGLK